MCVFVWSLHTGSQADTDTLFWIGVEMFLYARELCVGCVFVCVFSQRCLISIYPSATTILLLILLLLLLLLKLQGGVGG